MQLSAKLARIRAGLRPGLRLPGLRLPGLRLPGLRLPGQTVRLRLAIIYSGLFLLSGVALLAFTYLLVDSQSRGPYIIANPPAGLSILPAPDQQQIVGQQLQAEAGLTTAATLHRLLTYSGIALAVMAGLSVVLGWLVAGRALRPLRTITAAARQISASSLHQRLAMAGPDDELKELADTFDGLLGRLEGAFAAQRQFVANASHELRTPLTRQRTVVEVALADPEASVGSLRLACGQVLAASEQQERLIEALLTLARSERGLDHWEAFDLAAAVGQAVAAREPDAQRLGLQLRVRSGDALAWGDSRLAERLAANLVDNAVRHNTPAGWVEVATWTSAGNAVLAVTNSGPEVPADHVGRLFQPFQRLRPERTGHDGAGLGLPIVSAIAAAHGAALAARSRPDGGLAVEVSFPPPPPGGLPGRHDQDAAAAITRPAANVTGPASPAAATAPPAT
jgi:signal transduction histidine kinase